MTPIPARDIAQQMVDTYTTDGTWPWTITDPHTCVVLLREVTQIASAAIGPREVDMETQVERTSRAVGLIEARLRQDDLATAALQPDSLKDAGIMLHVLAVLCAQLLGQHVPGTELAFTAGLRADLTRTLLEDADKAGDGHD